MLMSGRVRFGDTLSRMYDFGGVQLLLTLVLEPGLLKAALLGPFL